MSKKSSAAASLLEFILWLIFHYSLSRESSVTAFIWLSVNTHVHADHITGTGFLKKQFPSCKSAISAASKADADVKLKEGDKLTFGKYELEVRSTPGHTNGKIHGASDFLATTVKLLY